MRGYHWGMCLLFLFIGYVIGLYAPGPGQRLKAAIGM